MKKLIDKTTLPKVGGLAVGAIGANLLVSKIPVGNEKIKNGIAIALGVVLGGQKGFMSNVGNGMIAAGAANLAKGFGLGGTLIGEAEDIVIEGLEDEDISGNADYSASPDERESY